MTRMDLHLKDVQNEHIPDYIPDYDPKKVMHQVEDILEKTKDPRYNVFHDSTYSEFTERYHELSTMIMKPGITRKEKKERIGLMLSYIAEAQKKGTKDFMKQQHVRVGQEYTKEFIGK